MSHDAANRVVVVTGANAGIGKAAAHQLAESGHHVVMVCRDTQKAEAAAADIRRQTPNGTITVVTGDLSSIAGVRALAQKLLADFPKIHVLINNAGVWMTRRQLNDDGLEMTFMVNHIAPFMLTALLVDRMKTSAPARVVMVNAGLYVNGEADLERLPTGENFHRFKTYMHSKLLNVYVSNEFARRLNGTGITVNALHPGVIRTNLGNSGGPLGLLLKGIKMLWKKPEDGAKPVVNLAISPELDDLNGAYYNEMEPMDIAANAQDPETQQRIWEHAEKTAQLTVNV